MVELMRAVLAEGPGRFSVTDVPAPKPGDGDLLVRPLFSGLCGSDFKILAGQVSDIGFPLVPGHEWVGEVIDAGGSSRQWIGKVIVSDILQNCGLCGVCRRGMHSLCEAMVEPGINALGSFSERMVVRADKAIAFPEELPVEVGALVEPLSVALHAVERATPVPGSDVVIFGGGGIGLLLAQVIRLYDVHSVTIVEPVAARRAAALRCGVDRAIDPAAGPLREQLGEARLLEPQLVIEAAGSIDAFEACIETVAKAGVVAIVGYPPGGKAEVDPSTIVRKRIDLRGILSPAASWARAVELLRDGKISGEPIITHRFELEQFADAFALAGSRRDGAIRVLVH